MRRDKSDNYSIISGAHNDKFNFLAKWHFCFLQDVRKKINNKTLLHWHILRLMQHNNYVITLAIWGCDLAFCGDTRMINARCWRIFFPPRGGCARGRGIRDRRLIVALCPRRRWFLTLKDRFAELLRDFNYHTYTIVGRREQSLWKMFCVFNSYLSHFLDSAASLDMFCSGNYYYTLKALDLQRASSFFLLLPDPNTQFSPFCSNSRAH